MYLISFRFQPDIEPLQVSFVGSMFSGVSRDSGCGLIHPEPNEAELSDFISSTVLEILFSFVYNTDSNS